MLDAVRVRWLQHPELDICTVLIVYDFLIRITARHLLPAHRLLAGIVLCCCCCQSIAPLSSTVPAAWQVYCAAAAGMASVSPRRTHSH